jgi:hypothetical protein
MRVFRTDSALFEDPITIDMVLDILAHDRTEPARPKSVRNEGGFQYVDRDTFSRALRRGLCRP